jgi:hypothetical protein
MAELASLAALRLSFYPVACAATPQAGIFLDKLENDFMWSV